MSTSKKVCVFSALIGAISLITLFPAPASSQVPLMMNYQGYLADVSGTPVLDGNYRITFSLYTAPTEGTPVWSETQEVGVTNGVFNVELGNTVPLLSHHFDEGWLYLGVWIVGEPAEMSPRQRLISVPFAIKANNADTLNGLDWSDVVGNFVDVTGDHMIATSIM
jgi:hypothetical protein